jgi:hypothetical protein
MRGVLSFLLAPAIAQDLLSSRPSSSAEHPCIQNTSAGLHEHVKCESVNIGAAWGHYIRVTYNVPKQCLMSECGVILDVHGGAMNAEQQNNNTNMRALGEQHGYIVIQPTAPPDKVPVNNWGLGSPTVDRSDDAVFDWLQQALAVAEWKIDHKRIHCMGFSEGGHMTWRMMVKHPESFASMVVIEAVETDEAFFPADLAQIPVLAQGGKHDVPEPYKSHLITWTNLRNTWGTDNGTVIAGDDHFKRTRYLTEQGVPFETLEHDYVAEYVLLGHCFPGSNDTHLINDHELPFVGPWMPKCTCKEGWASCRFLHWRRGHELVLGTPKDAGRFAPTRASSHCNRR